MTLIKFYGGVQFGCFNIEKILYMLFTFGGKENIQWCIFTEKYMGKDNLKIIFSFISVFLMIPSMIHGDDGYYRTLFIFLINRVIDMFGEDKKDEIRFLVVWSLINQWIGAMACAVAFSLIEPNLAAICKIYSRQINIVLFVIALSCVFKEMTVSVIASVKEKLIIKKIVEDKNGR